METFKDKQQEAFQRAAVICSKAEKSSGSIFRKLKEWELSEEEALPVIKKLQSEKFIDDERYARSYAQDKFRFNKWGKIKIAYNLRAEKIETRLIDNALDEIDDEEYYAVLEELLASKNQGIRSVNLYDKKAKLFRFARGRGFETDLIYSVLNEILKK